MLWGLIAVVLLGAAYVASLLFAQQLGLTVAEEALAILAFFGVAFPGVAWVLGRGVKAEDLILRVPGQQAALALLLTVVLAVYLIDGKAWVDAIVPASVSPAGHEAMVLAGKLVVFVVLPFIAFRSYFGTRWRDFGLSGATISRLLGRDGIILFVMAALFIAFQYFVGNAAQPIRSGEIAGPLLWWGSGLAFAWLIFEVGLVEEFFFRAMLQERLSQALNSPLAGLLFAAAIFGLVHAPGIAFRDAGVVEGFAGTPTLLGAAAYTILVQGVAGLTFGVIWMLTRSLPLVILLHAALDLLATVPGFVKTFGLG